MRYAGVMGQFLVAAVMATQPVRAQQAAKASVVFTLTESDANALQAKKLFGKMSLTTLALSDEPDAVRARQMLELPDAWRAQEKIAIERSALHRRAASQTTLDLAVNPGGVFEDGILTQVLDILAQKSVANMLAARADATLADAARTDPEIRAYIARTLKPLSNLELNHDDAPRNAIFGAIKLAALFSTDGTRIESDSAAKKILTHGLYDGLTKLPLAVLQNPEPVDFHHALNNNYVFPFGADDMVDRLLQRPALSRMNDITIGSVTYFLEPGDKDDTPVTRCLAFSHEKLCRVDTEVAAVEKHFIAGHTATMAEIGLTLGEFLHNPQDSTGTVAADIRRNPLLTLLAQAAAAPDKNFVPPTCEQVLASPLGIYLDDSSQIDMGRLRERLLLAVKDLSLNDVDGTFAKVLVGAEIAAIPVGERLVEAYYPNEAKDFKTRAEQIKFSLFLGDFEKNRAAIEKQVFPPQARAEFSIRDLRDKNPWPQFQNADGLTVIPCTFGLDKENVIVTTIASDVRELTAKEKRTFTLVQAAYRRIGIELQLCDKLPRDKNHLPTGIVLAAGNLNADLPTSEYAHGTSGDTVFPNRVSKTNSLVNVYLDTDVLASGNVETLSTFVHEIGHALGLEHPHDSKLPKRGHDRSLPPGITRNETIMSYTEATGVALTPMHADVKVFEASYGAHRPAGDAVFALQMADLDKMISHADAHALWVAPANSRPYTQNIVASRGVNKLDLSTLKGGSFDEVLDLDQTEHHLSFRAQGVEAHFSVTGVIPNAVINNGIVVAATGNPTTSQNAPDGTIELNGTGSLHAERPGNHLLIGGTGATTFYGGIDGVKTYKIRGAENEIVNYHPGKDKIIVDAGVASARFVETKTVHAGAHYRLDLLNASGAKIGTINLRDPQEIPKQNINLHSSKNGAVPVVNGTPAPIPQPTSHSRPLPPRLRGIVPPNNRFGLFT